MMAPLRLPPFGNVLLAYQNESIRLDFALYLFVGEKGREEACAQKRLGTLSTFLPLGEDYKSFNWPLKDQKVIVLDTGGLSEIYLKKMCYYLLRFKPRVVFLHSEFVKNELFLNKGDAYVG